MGAAIAEAARDRGAAVTLIAGAMSVTPPRTSSVCLATWVVNALGMLY